MTVVGPSPSRSDIIRSSPSGEAILRDDIIKCSSAVVVQPNQHVEEGSAARIDKRTIGCDWQRGED